WLDEEFHLHLLKLTSTEDEVTRGDLIAERLTNIGNAKWWLHARRGHHIFEVYEDTLCRFRTQVVQTLFIIDWAQQGLQQTRKRLRLRPLSSLAGFRIINICQAIRWWMAMLFYIRRQHV